MNSWEKQVTAGIRRSALKLNGTRKCDGTFPCGSIQAKFGLQRNLSGVLVWHFPRNHTTSPQNFQVLKRLDQLHGEVIHVQLPRYFTQYLLKHLSSTWTFMVKSLEKDSHLIQYSCFCSCFKMI